MPFTSESLHCAEIEAVGKGSLHEGHKLLHVAAYVGDYKEIDANARDILLYISRAISTQPNAKKTLIEQTT